MAKEATWFGQLIKELEIQNVYSITFYCENQDPISLAYNLENH